MSVVLYSLNTVGASEKMPNNRSISTTS